MTDLILRLFRERGAAAYMGEAVTELEHALQCAAMAENAGAPPTLIVAALLHDVGHLLHQAGEDIAEHGIDMRHEEIGAAWLEEHFPAAVSEPVRLHVAAKRYLCATDDAYRRALSPASERSLLLQGGPMSATECCGFEGHPHARAAIALRHWDDTAKIPDLAVPDLPHFLSYIEKIT